MKQVSENQINELVQQHDQKNMVAIARAFEKGRINAEAKEYLEILYSDGMEWYREVFYVLGKCFGAPKAQVLKYNYAKGCVENRRMNISEINPLSAYMVHHCLESDPMGNQFFNVDDDHHRVRVSASSIVGVIVAAEKGIARSLEKVTDKYYRRYIDDVADTVYNVISATERKSSAIAIADKVREKFHEKYTTNAPETVLAIIGRGHEEISVELVRALDKIEKPYLRLKDVWRVKCLFDMVPQARAFVDRIKTFMPDKILEISDKFYDLDNPRNYRDIKIVLNIGKNGIVIPMEIICQVRKLFEFERKNHEEYESIRKGKNPNTEAVEKKMAKDMENGIREYNQMICSCMDDLFERVGWNVLYGKRDAELLFDGFPNISKQYYPEKIINTIMEKLDNAVKNEVFRVKTAPIKLDKVEEMRIFRWMAKFLLVSAIPYKNADTVNSDSQSEKLFNFVIKELSRYYKN